jgi:hypothetical protein
LVLRGQRVLLDTDLAALYGVSVKRLNEQVKRNRARFPGDYVFQPEISEIRSLRSQFATLDTGRGRHSKYPPLAFTEHGAIITAIAAAIRGGLHGDPGADGAGRAEDAADRVHGGSGQASVNCR